MRKTTKSLTTPKLARLSVIGAGGALLISTLSGCSVIEGVVAPKAWAITYQLEVDGEGSDQLTGVNYGDTDGPVALDGETITTTVGNVTTDVEAETTVRTRGRCRSARKSPEQKGVAWLPPGHPWSVPLEATWPLAVECGFSAIHPPPHGTARLGTVRLPWRRESQGGSDLRVVRV